MGAKTKDLIIWKKKWKKAAGNCAITTDDGTYGRHGMVTKVIEDLTAEGKSYTNVLPSDQ